MFEISIVSYFEVTDRVISFEPFKWGILFFWISDLLYHKWNIIHIVMAHGLLIISFSL